MSNIPRNPNYLNPSLGDLLNFHADNLMMTLAVHHVGTISSFNADNQTANATIDYTKVNTIYNEQTGNFDIKASSYPAIVNAPVRFQHSITNGGFTCPPGPGDKCEIIFNDRDIDGWLLGWVNKAPNTARLHQISDAIIVIGVNPSAAPIPAFDAARPMMRDGAGTSFVAVNPANGKIQIQNTPSHNLETVLQSILTHLNSLASACAAITIVPGSLVCPNTGTGSPVPITGVSGDPVNASTFSTLASNLATDATNLAEILE